MVNFIKYIAIGFLVAIGIFLFKYPKQENKTVTEIKTENKSLTINLATSTSDILSEQAKIITESTKSVEEKSKSTVVVKTPAQTSTEKIVVPAPVKDNLKNTATTSQPMVENKPAVLDDTVEQKPKVPSLPPLDEESLLSSIVKIECPTSDGQGKYVGSGFAIKGDMVVTAAHVISESGSNNCTVIFSSKRKPIYYLRGTIIDLAGTQKLLNEKGIDLGVLKLPSLDSYLEAKAIFNNNYPYIPYPVCIDPKMRGDKLLHFGYPSNYADQNYLSEQNGEVVVYADINGIKEQLSEDQTYTFKSPIFNFTYDESNQHPYMVSRVASFYGDSGGLAFNATKQCVLGPHRGGTLGKSPGENYTVFTNIGWEGIQKIVNP